jgi:hypothetical protein
VSPGAGAAAAAGAPDVAAAAPDLAAAAASPSEAAAAAAIGDADVDGLMAAVDAYKTAILLAREKDLEAEAIATSRLGHLYKVRATV